MWHVLAVLSLPIAGLMADVPAQDVVEGYRAVLAAADRLGAGPGDPFMPLSFCPLTVIPHLKLGDRGLVDVDRFARVPLAAEPS
ncbi:MAG: adenine deaminase C-terminal domain-containing protein [Planctomycetota bacterium]